MPRTCTVCSHPDVSKINQALATHELPYRSIAKQYDVGPAAVYRHWAEHLPSTIAKAEDVKQKVDAGRILDVLNESFEDTNRDIEWLDELQKTPVRSAVNGTSKPYDSGAAALKVRNKTAQKFQAELLLKASGELDSAAMMVVLNLYRVSLEGLVNEKLENSEEVLALMTEALANVLGQLNQVAGA